MQHFRLQSQSIELRCYRGPIPFNQSLASIAFLAHPLKRLFNIARTVATLGQFQQSTVMKHCIPYGGKYSMVENGGKQLGSLAIAAALREAGVAYDHVTVVIPHSTNQQMRQILHAIRPHSVHKQLTTDTNVAECTEASCKWWKGRRNRNRRDRSANSREVR